MIEKREHSQAPTADRFHCGKIERDDAGLGLFSHGIAKLENGVATNDPALTFDYCEIVQVLNADGQHRILRLLITARTVPAWRSLLFSLIRPNEVLKPSTFGRLSGNVFLQRTLYLRRFACEIAVDYRQGERTDAEDLLICRLNYNWSDW